MPERGGVQRYIYWSDRRVRSVLGDAKLDVTAGSRRSRRWRLRTPFLEGERGSESEATRTHPELAALVEKKIGKRAVQSFETPPPVAWAKGTGSMVFGEFVDKGGCSTGRSLMYTRALPSDGTLVGICLFGSMTGYDDFLVEAGHNGDRGWTSSSAPDVLEFLRTRKADGPHDKQALAREALKITCAEGIDGPSDDPSRFNGWRRGFTFGDLAEVAEWFAEIYLDVRLAEPLHGHQRVLIGAPLWVRTSSAEAFQPYAGPRSKEPERD